MEALMDDRLIRWAVGLGELTEISGLGFMFFAGAVSHNELSTLLLQDEVMRRICAAI